LFWRWKSKPAGRPALPKNLRKLIRKMAAEKSHLGRGAYRQRVEIEAGNPGFPSHSAEVSG
jgi:hypothetical protein